MEARLEAVASPTRMWWTKLGKWQALMAALTLAAFFVTLGITGDTKYATFAAFVVVATGVVAFVAAIAAAAFAGVVAVAVASATATVFVTAVVAAVFTAFVITADEVPGIGKKAVWFSYAGEFLLVLLPMLWVLRG